MYKKDHETDKCNYRPISLLSISGKIMESAVDCLRADVSYFLCCTRATKEIGDVCTQASS